MTLGQTFGTEARHRWDHGGILAWLEPDEIVSDWSALAEQMGWTDLEHAKRDLHAKSDDHGHALLKRLLVAERLAEDARRGIVDFLPPDPDDADTCIAAFNRWLSEISRSHPVGEVWATRIDNWFGQKWCLFSGTIMHELAVWHGVPRLPPFHPNRVSATRRYKVLRNGGFERAEVSGPIEVHQTSTEALDRRVKDEFDGCALAWFSSCSITNGRCSVMMYVPTGQQRNDGALENDWRHYDQSVWPFFVELAKGKAGAWRVERLVGIGQKELENLGGVPAHESNAQ